MLAKTIDNIKIKQVENYTDEILKVCSNRYATSCICKYGQQL